MPNIAFAEIEPSNVGSLAPTARQSMTPSCPVCTGPLIRTSRRPIDRVLSIVTPLQRFRCPSFNCQFEGNLRVRYFKLDQIARQH